ncbi:MAG: ankyrin repeat domain-containing protein [Actinomycetota bacterium]
MKRRWEVGAGLLLLTVLALLGGGFLNWREHQRSLNRQLARALQEEKGELVHRLDKQGADIRTQDAAGTTVLMIAAGPGDPALLDRALAAQLDVNAMQGSGGHTPLIYAAVYDRADAVSKLLARGANPNLASAGGATPLLFAARGGRMEIVRALLQAGAKPDLQTRYTGVTPLMRAADKGWAGVVRLLIQAEANVRLRDTQGETALSRARRRGDAEIMQLLRKAGAKR